MLDSSFPAVPRHHYISIDITWAFYIVWNFICYNTKWHCCKLGSLGERRQAAYSGMPLGGPGGRKEEEAEPGRDRRKAKMQV